MMKCECYPNHHICKNLNSCEFWIPLNKNYQQLLRQLNYELKELQTLKQRKQEYFKILSEIQESRYSKTLNIQGKLTQVPKLNARDEYILKPEDVIVGLNYNVISQEITDTESIIRELRRKEQNILKILKKRADKYD